MAEDQKNIQSKFQGCCEGMPFAEMMEKMVGRQGVGSPCAEMMKKIMGSQKEGCSFHCAEVMQKMMKERRKVQKAPEEAKAK